MKFKSREIIALFTALSDLKGAPTVIVNSRGQREVIHEPYDLGPKFTWNAAKNRNILRRHVEAHDEASMDLMAQLNKLKRELAASKDSPADNAAKLQAETDRINEERRKLANEEVDVGLNILWLPASGLNLGRSRIPPTLIEELMPLIEGEPDFEQLEKSAQKK